MIDDYTRNEIDKISYNILKDSKSLDVFPTPVDKILDYSNFALDNKIDLENIDYSFFDTFKEKLFFMHYQKSKAFSIEKKRLYILIPTLIRMLGRKILLNSTRSVMEFYLGKMK